MLALLYGIGFGLLGEISITQLFFMACATLLVFILFAPFWLKWHRFGPMEWLGKMGTYMRHFSIRSYS